MDREKLTFEQAEGATPLPSQLEPGVLTQQLRALLWNYVHNDIRLYDYTVTEPWRSILGDMHVFHYHRMVDDFNPDWNKQKNALKALFSTGNYTQVLGFLQYVLRHPKCPTNFANAVNRILTHTHSAYRVVNSRTIAPMSSEEERATLEAAFADLANSKFAGARSHLTKAAEAASSGHWADSIRESVHSVEATARVLAPDVDSLEKALRKLESTAAIHGGLKKGFASIYGYTSEQGGIRHPLIDDANAKVDETDAIFMLGACAAFVSYLIGKGRTAGIVTT